MKKSKLSLGLVTSFIAAMALSACDVSAKDNALVTFTPYGGGEAVDIVTDAMYHKYRDTSDGVNKFYTQILEVLIRNKFNKGGLDGVSTLEQIKTKADTDVEAETKKASDNAKSNGTTYDAEWDKILDSYGVETTEELKEHFIYTREKDEISKWYLNNNIDQLRKEFIGVKADGTKVDSNVDSALPYHIAHILVKVESGAKDFYNGTVSSTEALKLYNTISKIKDGVETFAQIARKSDDGSGVSAFGDVGIMTNQIQSSGSLQMVSEFQLGIYTYEMFEKGSNTNATINEGLGFTGKFKDTNKTVADAFKEATGLVKVPYDAVEKIGKYANDEKDDLGREVSDGVSMLYPRNIIWNKYFNHHQAFVITNATGNVGASVEGLKTEAPNVTVNQFKNLTTNSYNDYGKNFVHVDGICGSANEKVLTDGNGHVIIGVRSEFGIHLIVVQKSIYDFNDATSLEEYYTTEVPSSSKYPKSGDQPKSTYVNYIESDSEYSTRATAVKDLIKSFDTTYDYRLYEDLMKEFASNISFAGDEGKKLNESIANYIKVMRANKHHTQVDKLNTVWENYIDMISLQEDTRVKYYLTRDQEDKNQYKTLMVPEGCAVNFHTGGADYEKGGKCYYGK